MEKFGSWGQAVESLKDFKINYPVSLTTETYRIIRDEIKLETVIWENFRVTKQDLREKLNFIHEFILKYHPCLFIFQPISLKEGLKKDALFDLHDSIEVENWFINNEQVIEKYSYLISTMIKNHGSGFVGEGFSDGNGRMIFETYHEPGNSNQWKLSRPDTDIEKFRDYFSTDEFRHLTLHKGLLSNSDIERIKLIYGNKKGYFEFIYGEQAGKVGIYTIGYETTGVFQFPDNMHELDFLKIRERVKALILLQD